MGFSRFVHMKLWHWQTDEHKTSNKR